MKKQSKYIEIANDISSAVNSGELAAGEKIPTEKELSEKYHVSRMTVRHAIQLLDKRNVVRIDQNRGAFALEKTVERGKDILSFTDLMIQNGYSNIHSKVVEMKLINPDADVHKALGIEDNDQVYFLKRIRYANDEVMAIEYANIYAKYFPGLEMFDFDKYSLYKILATHYNVEVTFARDDIRAKYITGEDARTLIGENKGPALIVSNTSYDKLHNPIEYTKTIYNYKLFTYTVFSTKAAINR